jgi:hypothetical protein
MFHRKMRPQSVFFLIKCIWATGVSIAVLLVFSTLQDKHQRATERRGDTRTILTLFTYLPPDPSMKSIYKATIRNWATLRPDVVPVLYANLYSIGDPLVHYAIHHGWRVRQIQKVNARRLPFINDLFIDAKKNFGSRFAAYASPGVLFDQGMVHTLRVLDDKIKTEVFVIGQRIDYQLRFNQTAPRLTSVDDFLSERGRSGLVSWGSLNCGDFLAISRGEYSWGRLLPIPAGLTGYDAYFLNHAIKNSFTVVIVTETMRALRLVPNSNIDLLRQPKDKRLKIATARRMEEMRQNMKLNAVTVKAVHLQTVPRIHELGFVVDIIPMVERKSLPSGQYRRDTNFSATPTLESHLKI